MADLILDINTLTGGPAVGEYVSLALARPDRVRGQGWVISTPDEHQVTDPPAVVDLRPTSDFESGTLYIVWWRGARGFTFAKTAAEQRLSEIDLMPVPETNAPAGIKFTDIRDTPETLKGQAGRAVAVLDNESGLGFTDVATQTEVQEFVDEAKQATTDVARLTEQLETLESLEKGDVSGLTARVNANHNDLARIGPLATEADRIAKENQTELTDEISDRRAGDVFIRNEAGSEEALDQVIRSHGDNQDSAAVVHITGSFRTDVRTYYEDQYWYLAPHHVHESLMTQLAEPPRSGFRSAQVVPPGVPAEADLVRDFDVVLHGANGIFPDTDNIRFFAWNTDRTALYQVGSEQWTPASDKRIFRFSIDQTLLDRAKEGRSLGTELNLSVGFYSGNVQSGAWVDFDIGIGRAVPDRAESTIVDPGSGKITQAVFDDLLATSSAAFNARWSQAMGRNADPNLAAIRAAMAVNMGIAIESAWANEHLNAEELTGLAITAADNGKVLEVVKPSAQARPRFRLVTPLRPSAGIKGFLGNPVKLSGEVNLASTSQWNRVQLSEDIADDEFYEMYLYFGPGAVGNKPVAESAWIHGLDLPRIAGGAFSQSGQYLAVPIAKVDSDGARTINLARDDNENNVLYVRSAEGRFDVAGVYRVTTDIHAPS